MSFKGNDIEIAVKAMNKWVFFCWNYPLNFYEWVDERGNTHKETLPVFLKEIEWSCGFNHMYKKWNETLDKCSDSTLYLMKFYAELSTDNRKLLLEWVVNNYSDEQKVIY